MWSDRYTVYYSKEKRYAVRWLPNGRPEEEAQYKRFDDKVEAERFYNQKLLEVGATCRLELFFSQAKWVSYYANRDETGETRDDPIGESSLCLGGDHDSCTGPLAEVCTCPHHHQPLLNAM